MNTEYLGIEWLYDQIPNYQAQGLSAYQPGLERISNLAEKFQNPQNQFKSIHIAGTNGKGSTAHMLSSILQESGYKVGLFTSPHLKRFTERIRINGQEVSFEPVDAGLLQIKDKVHEIHSFFEITTLLAFLIFKEEQVDFAIIETGLGGRLDATNIITPQVSVITNIALDHTKVLGNTLEKIATEKAGIIKEEVPVVLGKMPEMAKETIEHITEQKKATVYFSNVIPSVLATDLKGKAQVENQKTARTCIEVLQGLGYSVPEKAIENGLLKVIENTGLRGRWEAIQERPKIILDTAHNPDGISQVLEQLRQENYGKAILIIGFVQGKEIEEMLALFPKEEWVYIFTQPNNPRTWVPKDYRNSIEVENYHLIENSQEAYKKAQELANEEDIILVTGSNFLIADVL